MTFRQPDTEQDKSNDGLRLPSFFAACFLVVAAIVLAYLAGVMRGRTHADSADGQHAAVNAATTDKTDDRYNTQQRNSNENQRILAPEELRFASILRDTPTTAPRTQSFKPVTATPQSAAQPDAIPRTAENPSPQPTQQQSMNDYVFQVAALKNEDSVDALRQRLEGKGLRTRMQRDGKRFLVLVLLRGDETRAAEITQLMADMRLGKPVVRSRKPLVAP
ncbi:hypothetical protein AGMMS49974_09970 [Deltaproteobacteria bacterium]|nr:hypothetical protein AGMMS49974_09970 [Deltaproteobacteria bacterium]